MLARLSWCQDLRFHFTRYFRKTETHTIRSTIPGRAPLKPLSPNAAHTTKKTTSVAEETLSNKRTLSPENPKVTGPQIARQEPATKKPKTGGLLNALMSLISWLFSKNKSAKPSKVEISECEEKLKKICDTLSSLPYQAFSDSSTLDTLISVSRELHEFLRKVGSDEPQKKACLAGLNLIDELIFLELTKIYKKNGGSTEGLSETAKTAFKENLESIKEFVHREEMYDEIAKIWPGENTDRALFYLMRVSLTESADSLTPENIIPSVNRVSRENLEESWMPSDYLAANRNAFFNFRNTLPKRLKENFAILRGLHLPSFDSLERQIQERMQLSEAQRRSLHGGEQTINREEKSIRADCSELERMKVSDLQKIRKSDETIAGIQKELKALGLPEVDLPFVSGFSISKSLKEMSQGHAKRSNELDKERQDIQASIRRRNQSLGKLSAEINSYFNDRKESILQSCHRGEKDLQEKYIIPLQLLMQDPSKSAEREKMCETLSKQLDAGTKDPETLLSILIQLQVSQKEQLEAYEELHKAKAMIDATLEEEKLSIKQKRLESDIHVEAFHRVTAYQTLADTTTALSDVKRRLHPFIEEQRKKERELVQTEIELRKLQEMKSVLNAPAYFCSDVRIQMEHFLSISPPTTF